MCATPARRSSTAPTWWRAGGTVIGTMQIIDRCEACVSLDVPNVSLVEYKAPPNYRGRFLPDVRGRHSDHGLLIPDDRDDVERDRDEAAGTESPAASSCIRAARRTSRPRCWPRTRDRARRRENDTAKTTPAKRIGVNASSDAPDLRRAVHAQERIHRHQRADDERRQQAGVVRRQPRRPDATSTNRFATRIITSTAKNTTELTIHVPPKSSAMCTTALVSTSMKPAPRKNICDRIRRCGCGLDRRRAQKRQRAAAAAITP